MRLMQLLGAALAMVVLAAGPTSAGVIIFSNDLPGFTAAMSGNTLLGLEDFEGSTLGPSDVLGFDDPLTQGVANGPYLSGLVQPMTVQSNLGGGSPSSPSLRGVEGLAAVSAGFSANTSDVVVANFFVDSLDWIFSPADQIAGVGLNTISFFGASSIDVRVFDTSNVLLDMTTITGDEAGTNHLGIAATGGDLIGRINFFSTGGGAEGGDNAALFQQGAQAIPEPASVAVWGIGAIAVALGAAIRRRRHAHL